METVLIYYYLLIVFFVISIAIGHSNSIRFKYLKYLLIVTVIIESIGLYYLKILKDVAHWAFTIYHPIEFYLLATYFSYSFHNSKNKKVAIRLKYTIPLLIFTIGLASLKINFPLWFNFLTSSIFIIFLSLSYLKELLFERINSSLTDNPDFFICIGILTFHSASFLVMGLVNYVYQSNPDLARQVYSINHILNITYYGLITYAFYIQWKLTKSSLSS